MELSPVSSNLIETGEASYSCKIWKINYNNFYFSDVAACLYLLFLSWW